MLCTHVIAQLSLLFWPTVDVAILCCGVFIDMFFGSSLPSQSVKKIFQVLIIISKYGKTKGCYILKI